MTRIVEVSAAQLGAARDDVSRTRDRIDDDLDALRRRAAWLGVPTAGFDGALDVRDRLGSTVLPVLDAHVRRAQDLEAARYGGMTGVCLPVVDDDPWPDPVPGFGAEPALDGGSVLTWAPAPAEEEAADQAEAHESRGVGGWFSDRWDDVSGAADQGLDWLGDRAGDAWDGITDVGAAIGDWWEAVTADLGEWIDTELADVRTWIGEHVAVFRFLASAFRVVGWVVVAVGVVLTIGLAIIGAMGGAAIGAVFGFGVGAVPGGAAGAAAGAAFGLKVLGAGFTLVAVGDFLDVMADWGEGTIDGQQLVQRGSLEIGLALTAFLGAGALGKALQKIVDHLPASARGRLDDWIERLLRRGDDVGEDLLEGGARRLDDLAPDPDYGLPRTDAGEELVDWAKPPTSVSDDIAALGGDPAHPWGVDPSTGHPLTESEWLARYAKDDGTPRWPPNNGAVPGSRVAYDDVDAFLSTHGTGVDRIGSPRGEYLGIPPGGSWQGRSLAPSSLGQELHGYEFTGDLPDGWSIEVSQIAPAFGQAGGGTQIRVLDSRGNATSVQAMIDEGVLR